MNDTDYGDFKRRRQENIWHLLNRVVIALIAIAVVTLILCAFIPELKKQREHAARLQELNAAIEKEKSLLAQRTREVELLKNDPVYVETVARDRLGLMKEGETIFRLETPKPVEPGVGVSR